jgi:hypothetical protein
MAWHRNLAVTSRRGSGLVGQAIMKPSALLVTLSEYSDVTSVLYKFKAAHDLPGVDLEIKAAPGFDDVPLLMRSDVDLIALDGHGCKNGYYGLHCERRFCPEYLRGEDGAGIAAPIVVLAFCWGGRDPFISALEGSLGRSNAAFLGSRRKTKYSDAKRIYLPILQQLAELGPSPDPGAAHTRLTSIAPDIGPGWRSELLSCRDDLCSGCESGTEGRERV